MSDNKEKTQRRVYALPTELVDRILSYQKEMGLASEVEAARRLLDFALQNRDTVERLLVRLGQRFSEEKDLRVLASEILMPHVLVRQVSFNEQGWLTFEMHDKSSGAINQKGDLWILVYPDDGTQQHYESFIPF